MKRWIIPIIALVLIAVITTCVIVLFGKKGSEAQASDLMEGIEAKDVENVSVVPFEPVITDFTARLFRECYEDGKNQLISPISVISALGMTANGAKGNTLAQMEDVFGVSAEELNKYLHSYMESLSVGEKYKLTMANSIWLRDSLKNVRQDFLQTNADYYGADIYRRAFDNVTLNDINKWVDKKTDHMIPAILEQISDDDMMFLINALCFDAKWQDPYEDSSVRDDTFTREDGSTKNVKMMYSTEHRYLENELVTGFLKYYADKKYAFVALLPKEGKSMDECVSGLDGEAILKLLRSVSEDTVLTRTPKFKAEYTIEMCDVLKEMGIEDAFDSRADFSGIAPITDDTFLYIGTVIHKTFIELDEKGTKAAAATMIGMKNSGALMMDEQKKVYLDRPFIYMIIDRNYNVPLFIGTMTDPES